MRYVALFAPHEEATIGALCGKWVERHLIGAFVEHLRARPFLGSPYDDRVPVDDLTDRRQRVMHVADHKGLSGTDYDAGRFESDIESVRAEIALLG